jgi:hypothetical protein
VHDPPRISRYCASTGCPSTASKPFTYAEPQSDVERWDRFPKWRRPRAKKGSMRPQRSLPLHLDVRCGQKTDETLTKQS